MGTEVVDLTLQELMDPQQTDRAQKALAFIEEESQNISNQISVINKHDTSLNDLLQIYNEKYGLEYDLTNIADFFKKLPSMSDIESRNLEVITKDIGYKVSLILKTKLILSLSKMIDKSIGMMTAEMASSEFTTEYALENIERLWGWLDQVNNLMADSEIHGIESKIRSDKTELESGNQFRKELEGNGYDAKEILDLMLSLKKSQ